MTITSTIIKGTFITTIFFALSVLALNAYADTRGTTDRDRETSGRITQPPQPPTPPPPAPTPSPSNPSGGITNVTTGEVSSGGNTGGNVTTGDEHLEIFVVNIGPTNTSDSIEGTSGGQSDPAPTDPLCSSDRRAPDACSDDSPRTR